MFIAAQIISGFSVFVIVLSLLSKKNSTTLFYNAIANIFTIVVYFLLGRYVASLIVIGGFTRTIIFAILSEKNAKPHRVIPFLFDIYFIVITIILWQDALDLFMLFNYCFMTHAFSQRNQIVLKFCYIVSCVILTPYNIIIKAYGELIKIAVQLVFAIIGIFISIKSTKKENITNNNQQQILEQHNENEVTSK